MAFPNVNSGINPPFQLDNAPGHTAEIAPEWFE